MWLIYADESYCDTYYLIAALLVAEAHASPLSKALDTVVSDARRRYPELPPRPELHGHDLYQGKRDWVALHDMPRARIGVYQDAFQAIADHDTTIITRSMHIPG